MDDETLAAIVSNHVFGLEDNKLVFMVGGNHAIYLELDEDNLQLCLAAVLDAARAAYKAGRKG